MEKEREGVEVGRWSWRSRVRGRRRPWRKRTASRAVELVMVLIGPDEVVGGGEAIKSVKT